ncbi:MAG: hypothetical protein QFB87_02725 [Patescibacteria group bacterium]|nr:hypothetical protein [Patescibacteria group bacterium]
MTTHEGIKPRHFFKDHQGRIVIWQWPNIPLYGWLAFKILSLPINKSPYKSGFDNVSKAFLFTWAFLEITQGVNYFRKLLGVIVMLVLILGFFKR